jgi:hypothetical protein
MKEMTSLVVLALAAAMATGLVLLPITMPYTVNATPIVTLTA